jgi:putative heme-binding domain-containing protein
VQLAATRALGRIGDKSAVETLSTFISNPLERVTEHAAIYALIELNDFSGTVPGLTSSSQEVQSRTLWALNGMKDFSLNANLVLGLLSSASDRLVDTIVSICKMHPDWAEEIAEVFHQQRTENRFTEPYMKASRQLATHFLYNENMRVFVGSLLETNDWAESAEIFRIISNSPQKVEHHPSWSPYLESALRSGHTQTLSLALDALAKINGDEFDSLLRNIAANTDRPNLIRIKAMNAIPEATGPLNSAAFTMLKELLSSTSRSSQRIEAANLLSNAKLTAKQRLEVVALIRSAGPLELPLLIDVFTKTRDSATGFALVDALESSMSTNALSASELQRLLASYPTEVLDHAKPLVKQLFAQEEEKETSLSTLVPELETGIAPAGRQVFLSGKGACITCHKIGEDGREVGPDLSQIGQLRTKRDLLESILFPSTSLARDFEPYQIETADGQTHLGVIHRETSETLFLLDASATSKAIPRSSIQSILPGPVSLMPQGLDQTMTKQELLDLVAYMDSLE